MIFLLLVLMHIALMTIDGASSVVCDHIEIAEKGRMCEICSVQLDEGQLCLLCTRTMNELHTLQASPGYGISLVHVLTSLQTLGQRHLSLGSNPGCGYINETD